MLNGEIVERDGNEYLNFSKMDLKVTVGGGQVRLENLFNGDKVLRKYKVKIRFNFIAFNCS